jgi:hypothetical protein
VVNRWSTPYAEGSAVAGDVEAVDVTAADPATGARQPYGASVWAGAMACRSDGAVVLVDQLDHAGDLLVLRPGGQSTRLGRGYSRVFGD